MSKLQVFVATLIFAITPTPAAEEEGAHLIQEALLALPLELRANAAVVKFENGEKITLRDGANGLVCRVDDRDVPGIAIWCYPQSHDAYARRWYELAAQDKDSAAVNAIITAEFEAGELEWPDVAVNYNLRGESLDTAVATTVVFIPFATGETLGITEERKFRAPWLMLAGTAFAHIMIPGQ